MKRVVITGATGQLGRPLSARLIEQGYEVIVFSRDPEAAKSKVPGAANYIAWQAVEDGPWVAQVDGADAVISLAGAPTFGVKWTEEYRQEIERSRRIGTRGLVNAIASAKRKPGVIMYASGVGAYGFSTRSDEPVTEATVPDQDRFADTTAQREAEAARAAQYGARWVAFRIGFVLDSKDGGLPSMAQAVRERRGGIYADGTQYLPWIHSSDLTNLFIAALDNPKLAGGINSTAPDVVTNRTFMETLGRVVGYPVTATIPASVLEQAMGEGSAILLKGRKVYPARALEAGFSFAFPTLESALTDLLK